MGARISAALCGDRHEIRSLLHAGADINEKDDDGRTALHHAAKAGECAAIEELLNQRADINVTDKKGRTALHLAAGQGHYAAVDLLLRFGADPNALDFKYTMCLLQRYTALHHAAYKGHCDVMRLLLDRGADVNIVGRTKWPVLHSAAVGGHCEAINILLEHGMDIDSRNGSTPLICGVEYGNNDGSTALHEAAFHGHCNVVRLLCSRGDDINKEGLYGKTPLMYAAEGGHPRVIDLALSLGARLDERDDEGNTALHRAGSTDCTLDTVVQLLCPRVDVNARNNWGATPLHVALTYGDPAVVEALLLAGAKCGVKNDVGKTPEDMAQKHDDVHKILVYHKSHFPNLQRSCRLKILSALGHQRKDKISQLGIPQALKNYLLFEP